MPDVLDHADVDAALERRRLNWERHGDELVKVIKRHDFVQALAYVNEVGARAEAAGHHPDIDIRWATVTLRLSTHSAGGLTDADLNLAEKIDGIGSA